MRSAGLCESPGALLIVRLLAGCGQCAAVRPSLACASAPCLGSSRSPPRRRWPLWPPSRARPGALQAGARAGRRRGPLGQRGCGLVHRAAAPRHHPAAATSSSPAALSGPRGRRACGARTCRRAPPSLPAFVAGRSWFRMRRRLWHGHSLSRTSAANARCGAAASCRRSRPALQRRRTWRRLRSSPTSRYQMASGFTSRSGARELASIRSPCPPIRAYYGRAPLRVGDFRRHPGLTAEELSAVLLARLLLVDALVCPLRAARPMGFAWSSIVAQSVLSGRVRRGWPHHRTSTPFPDHLRPRRTTCSRSRCTT